MKKRLSLLAAFTLPPQVVTETWVWQQELANLQTRAARRLEVLDTQPLLHGLMRLGSSKNSLELATSDASELRTLPLQGAGRTLSSLSSERMHALFGSPAEPMLRVQGQHLSVEDGGTRLVLKAGPSVNAQSIWTVNLPGGKLEWENPGSTLVGWGHLSGDQVLFHLQSGWGRLKKLIWDSSVEVVDLLVCDARRQVVVENVPAAGLSRFVFLRDGRPEAYTVFDFSGGKRQSDVTAAVARSCLDFVVGGSFGLTRVIY